MERRRFKHDPLDQRLESRAKRLRNDRVCPVRDTCVTKRVDPEIQNERVRVGSWSCENAKTRDRDRRSYSSETALALNRASVLNLTNELKNVILAAFRSFAFLHTQGQELTCRWSLFHQRGAR